jgi:carbamoylphosphate synthase small subunit
MEHQAAGGVLVVDFGAQYSQLIARRVRECRVFSAIVPHDISPDEVARIAPGGIILSGGPASVYEDGAPAVPNFSEFFSAYFGSKSLNISNDKCSKLFDGMKKVRSFFSTPYVIM